MPAFTEWTAPGGWRIHVVAGADTITRIGFGKTPEGCTRDDRHALLGEAVRQLSEYFSGLRRVFELPVALQGTAFQRRVWEALRSIPYGETRSYAALARMVACPAARAVGQANGANPVAIVIPCHRVIATGGGLGGYGGGLALKRFLLDLEAGVPGTIT